MSNDIMKSLLRELEDHAKWVRENYQTFDKEKALEEGFKIVEEELKPKDHEKVKRRIQLAVEQGWSSFYFWVYEGDAEPYMLFGLNGPVGYQEQVPFFETFETQKELNFDDSKGP